MQPIIVAVKTVTIITREVTLCVGVPRILNKINGKTTKVAMNPIKPFIYTDDFILPHYRQIKLPIVQVFILECKIVVVSPGVKDSVGPVTLNPSENPPTNDGLA